MQILLVKLINLYEIVLIVRIVLTWVPHNPYHPAARFLYRVTDPVLMPVRKVVPPIMGMDISPIIVFIGLGFLKRMLF